MDASPPVAVTQGRRGVLVGLESMILRARRDLKQVLGHDPTLADIAELLKVPAVEIQRAWRLLNLPPGAMRRHLDAGRERLTQEEYLALSLRLDATQGGVHGVDQIAAAMNLPEAAVLRLEDTALAKLREVRSRELP